jgi:drug/metabolite transporter (DMT)-like permease
MNQHIFERLDKKSRGILWMLATYFCFIVLDAIIKYGLESMSLVEVTWGRFFFATIFAALICGKSLGQLLKTETPGIHTLRSGFLMLTTGLFNAGVARVPLATATTVMYLSPIFVTLLSILVLGEKVGLRRWAGIAMGFLGALIVINPWSAQSLSGINIGVLFLIGAALTNSCYQITTRKLRHEDPYTSLLFTASAGAIVSSALLPWFWTSPSALDWVLMIAAGAAGTISHYCLIRAFQNAPASVLAPFAYSSLLWATAFGFIIWGEWPTFNTWIGAALIVTAGLYIFVRERRLKASIE